MKLVTDNLEEILFEELNKSSESIMIISPFENICPYPGICFQSSIG